LKTGAIDKVWILRYNATYSIARSTNMHGLYILSSMKPVEAG